LRLHSRPPCKNIRTNGNALIPLSGREVIGFLFADLFE
jgi:hypothetical protein